MRVILGTSFASLVMILGVVAGVYILRGTRVPDRLDTLIEGVIKVLILFILFSGLGLLLTFIFPFD